MNSWISAFRLRTLPLALSSIIAGTFIAKIETTISISVFVFACLTTILLQITSNLANDLGDSLKGTDNDNRVGPKRAVQSGSISIPKMKKAVLLLSLLSLFSGLYLLYIAIPKFNFTFVIMLLIGLLAIVAAIKYTLGKGAYGYSGLGDFFVLAFFGFVGVNGANFLQTYNIFDYNLYLSLHIGLLSVAVLNLNNMRDIDNDRASGKNTIVVKFGLNNSKRYHITLILVSFIALLLTSYFSELYLKTSFYFLGVPYLILIPHALKVLRITEPKEFDPELKKVAFATLLSSICIAIHIVS